MMFLLILLKYKKSKKYLKVDNYMKSKFFMR